MDKVKVKFLLNYGNSTQKDSLHNGDQLELFSKKEMRNAWLTKTQFEANTEKIEVLSGHYFKEKE